MLKAHVLGEQLFYSEAFRIFIDTFLGKQNGVLGNIGNACKLSNTTNSVTVYDGYFCIRGGFYQVEGSDTLNVSTSVAGYGILVCEVDLSKENTENELNQATLKVVTTTSSYPTLKQEDIVGSKGIYQFEFARFKIATNGITEFNDTRTYLDFSSIYTKVNSELTEQLNLTQEQCNTFLGQLQELINNVTDGSAYLLKNNIAVIEGSWNLKGSTDGINYTGSMTEIVYPTGFTKDNCVALAIGRGIKINNVLDYHYGEASRIAKDDSASGSYPMGYELGTNRIYLLGYNSSAGNVELYYRVVLMRIS